MTDQEHRTPTLSIQPNPKYYVPTRGHLFERLKSMINASEGGVYGVTGVRGAGKSILLESIARHYRKANHPRGSSTGSTTGKLP